MAPHDDAQAREIHRLEQLSASVTEIASYATTFYLATYEELKSEHIALQLTQAYITALIMGALQRRPDVP